MHRCLTTAVLAAAALLAPSLASAQADVCPDASVELVEVPGTIESDQSVEISGMAFSAQSVNGEEVLWVINDDDNDPILEAFLVPGGEVVAQLDLTDVLLEEDHDFEDLAIGPCPSNADLECIFVADTGDDQAADTGGATGRALVHLYVFEEPTLPAEITPGVAEVFAVADFDVAAVSWSYDQDFIDAADSEAFFVDRITGDAFLVTKFDNEDVVRQRLFRIAVDEIVDGAVLSLAPETTLNLDLVSDSWTKADMSRDGTTIVIGSRLKSLFWVRQDGQTVTEALAQESCFSVDAPAAGAQHDAITFGFKAVVIYELPGGVNQDITESTLTGFGLEEVEEENDDEVLSDLAISAIAVVGVVSITGAAFLYSRGKLEKDGQDVRHSFENDKAVSPGQSAPYPQRSQQSSSEMPQYGQPYAQEPDPYMQPQFQQQQHQSSPPPDPPL